MKSIFLFFISLLFNAFLYSQNQQQDSLILGAKKHLAIQIQPYKVVWAQEVVESNGKKRVGINTITDIVKIDSINHMKVIKRVLEWKDTNNNVYTKSDILKYGTLQPISIDIRWNPSYVQHTDFKETTAISFSLKNTFDDTKVSISKLKSVDFSWSSDGFPLIAAQDVAEELFYMKVLNGLPNNINTKKKVFKILKSETLNIDQLGAVKTKVIEDISGGNIKTTYWLSKEKPYIVKVRFIQPDNLITTWKIKKIE